MIIDRAEPNNQEMSHIEFLGPPGAGKSAIFSQLIANKSFFGGVEDDAVRRLFLKKAPLKYRVPYQITPTIVRRFFEDEFIRYRLGHTALEEFIREYPAFIPMVSDAMDTASYEPEKIFFFSRHTAEQYQMGASTVREDEILCLDEGFAQRAFTVLWRCPNNSFSLAEYFQHVPTPDLVIHVDAPSIVCLNRQRKRGSVAVSKDWETDNLEKAQKRTKNLCLKVRNNLPETTSVLLIENTNSIGSAVENVRQTIGSI